MGAWGCANAESDFSSMLRPSRTHGVSGALQKHFLNFNQGGDTVCWNNVICRLLWESRSNTEIWVWLSDLGGVWSHLSSTSQGDVWNYSKSW